MLFQIALEFIYKNIYLNIILLVIFIIVCRIVYINSIKSRKYYVCPNCGESFRSEHMTSKCCKVCGANLEEKLDKNTNDNAKDNE